MYMSAHMCTMFILSMHHVNSVQGIDYMHVSFYPVCVLRRRVKFLVVWLYTCTCMCKVCESKMFFVFYQS